MKKRVCIAMILVMAVSVLVGCGTESTSAPTKAPTQTVAPTVAPTNEPTETPIPEPAVLDAETFVVVNNRIVGVTDKMETYLKQNDGVLDLNGTIDGKIITEIGEGAFKNCKELKSVIVSSKVKSIGFGTFEDCTALENITVPFVGKGREQDKIVQVSFEKDGLIEYSYKGIFLLGNLANEDLTGSNFGYIFGAETYEKNEENVPKTLKEVTITGTNEIKERAFYDCKSIESVDLNYGSEIADNAFEGCACVFKLQMPGVIGIVQLNALDNLHMLLKLLMDNFDNMGTSMYLNYTFENGALITDQYVLSTDYEGFYSWPDRLYNEYHAKLFDKADKRTAIVWGNSGTVIPADGSVEVIGFQAFMSSKIKEVVIPENVIVDVRAFSSCSELETVVVSDGVSFIGEGGAFEECTALKNVTLGKVKELGPCAFINCRSLTEITLPNTLTKLEDSAFCYCSFTSIDIPDSVKVLGNGVFRDCANLTSIRIPSSIESIGSDAFYGTAIPYTDYNGGKYLGNEENPYLILISGTLTSGIHEKTKIIGNNAFTEYSKLTSIVIPDGVRQIGEAAFYCTGLTSVTIPDSVTSIGNLAFFGCERLATVAIGNGVTSIGYDAFRGCGLITSVNMGNSVTSIGDGAFAECWRLTSMTIPNSVTSIEASTFYCCESLTLVTIPDSVTSIGDMAFYDCTSLKSVTIPNSIAAIGTCAFGGCTSLTSVTIPNGVTVIEYETFGGCTSLKSVTIPNSVTSIGGGAFAGCTSLKSVTIPDSVTSIGTCAFDHTSLTSVTIPNSITKIEENVFDGCTELTSVNIPNSVTSIEHRAFADCKSLTSIVIPGSVTSIGNYAFYDCTSLTSVTIPDSVTSIGGWAFGGCTSLKSVTIPNSITKIEACVFVGCTELNSVNYNGTKAQWNAVVGHECAVTIPVVCTDGTVDLFTPTGEPTPVPTPAPTPTPAPGYSEGMNYSFDEETKTAMVTGIGACGDAKIVIPAKYNGYSVTSIGDMAFTFCVSLTSVIIPDSMTSIGDMAFNYCLSLTAVTVPDSVTSIGSGAFANCLSLTSVIYNGTRAQWNAVSGHEYVSVPVICTDGTVEVYTPTPVPTFPNAEVVYDISEIDYTGLTEGTLDGEKCVHSVGGTAYRYQFADELNITDSAYIAVRIKIEGTAAVLMTVAQTLNDKGLLSNYVVFVNTNGEVVSVQTTWQTSITDFDGWIYFSTTDLIWQGGAKLTREVGERFDGECPLTDPIWQQHFDTDAVGNVLVSVQNGTSVEFGDLALVK